MPKRLEGVKRESTQLTARERYIGRASAYSFENHWKNASKSVQGGFDPEYCKRMVDYAILRLKDQVDHPQKKITPPQRSEFAREIQVPTRRLDEWADLFPKFREALAIFTDIHREMLINGGLVGRYSDRMTRLLMSHYHQVSEKSEPTSVTYNLIPMTAVDAIQFLMKQHGQKPVKLDAQDAEYREVG